MINRWMLGLMGMGMGFLAMGSAMATPDVASYNCLSREVWSPEKQAWCGQFGSAMDRGEMSGESDVVVAVNDVLSDRLQGTEWILEDLNGTGVMDRVQTTIAFEEGGDRINGAGGCNRYFSGITFNNEGATSTSQTVSLDVIGSTQMACPQAVMDQEGRYFQSLQSAERIELDGPYLYIYSEGQEQPMRFTQVNPNTSEPIRGLW